MRIGLGVSSMADTGLFSMRDDQVQLVNNHTMRTDAEAKKSAEEMNIYIAKYV